jgi:hypothetical protein
MDFSLLLISRSGVGRMGCCGGWWSGQRVRRRANRNRFRFAEGASVLPSRVVMRRLRNMLDSHVVAPPLPS